MLLIISRKTTEIYDNKKRKRLSLMEINRCNLEKMTPTNYKNQI